jgi:hypothetical protein
VIPRKPIQENSDGQSVEAQVRQLRATGALKVCREVASGAKTGRAQFRRLLAEIGPATWWPVMRFLSFGGGNASSRPRAIGPEPRQSG